VSRQAGHADCGRCGGKRAPLAARLPRGLLTPEEQSTLAERVRSREPAAEEELVHLFADRIGFLVFARTGDREIAPDLTQDVMLAVVRALRNGHLRDAERLAAFVYGTARNVINNYLRNRSRLPGEEPLDPTFHAASVPDAVEDNERATLVRRALAALDPTDRQILWLTLVEGLKSGEIAVRLGLASEVVRTRKSRATKKMTDSVKRLSRT
jgi:RNA polymerase sigma factor (sigma-70 family)